MTKIGELLERYQFNEMSNIEPAKTGLVTFIYVSPEQGSHSPRIKVANDSKIWSEDNFSVTISDNPKVVLKRGMEVKISSRDLELVIKFIKENKNILLDYWNKKIMTSDLYAGLKKVN